MIQAYATSAQEV